ncbi:hypothetical protein SCHPADRAFT_993725 [Schizopora paradoxa]|uniref:DUF7770 domain-containing protein n=1 Tax=Schizopora paradoxa TaxID=27342 RepID=A0A0H2S304_9AGAM|nr:hypothetical protein SCHPADRAFT_993725 [Schizopora paradoxa]
MTICISEPEPSTIKDWVNKSADYDAYKALKVRQIVLCGIPVAPTEDSVCHWCMHLIVDKSQSVTLDMRPCGPGNLDPMIGVLNIHPTVSDMANDSSAVEYVVETLMEVAVETIVDILRGFNRHHYRFDETGSGCRYWCSIALGDLENVRIVAAGSMKEFHARVKELHEENKSRFPMPIPKGKFF